jgi:hypothetical protein
MMWLVLVRLMMESKMSEPHLWIDPLGVWEMMRAGMDLDQVRQNIPDALRGDFDAIRSHIQADYESHRGDVGFWMRQTGPLTDQEIALSRRVPADIKPAIFLMRKSPDRLKEYLFKLIRPTGSTAMNMRNDDD